MQCQRCGRMLPEEARFCVNCGAPLAVEQPETREVVVRKERRGVVTVALVLLLQIPIVILQIIGAVLSEAFSLDGNTTITVFGAIGAMLAILVLGGKRLLAWDTPSIAFAWRHGWWAVAVSLILGALQIGTALFEGEPVISEGWVLRTLSLVVLCVSIGISEEGVFRGLFFEGMLDAFGKRKAGIVAAAVVSSMIFGFAHVVGPDLNLSDPLSIVQAALKTIQTGELGFFWAVIVLRTGNLLGPAMLHMLDDFFLMVPTSGLLDAGVDPSYISTGEDAIAVIVLYSVIIVLYLPLVWKGIKLLKETEAPQRGALHKEKVVKQVAC